ncbi:5'-nucleotidase C-terminal domain-containing protein [Mesorhizobium sp. L-8-3]|uniref:5'-nucleotidase C-terminal domain-containing protein n=1 Tax=Mesorhizobium sp. L-8-3 TaxID=2744522 RepID=UPI0019278093|nr:5'-nucleotidase C-terminal domain-containing protein [Mesorhizobium sp. L-8-3]BCH23073.1 multifunctional 2',3'-cyclic-nucleotide 2'-phosphodiesterase/5'-nucleotidase/3'-nucleotidase [Mesorhizobium sp. L-8-3]
MRKMSAIAAGAASMLALSAGASFADYTLTILHINDWHSRIESNNKYESTCSAEEEGKGECFGGAARLVTAIADRRKALDGQNVLLLNGGDNFQGSLFYTTYKGTAEAEFLNMMKFDAMTVGNHEFDDGEEVLVPFLEEVNFPVLSANVHADAKSKVGDKIKPSIVVEVGGQKIGIIGAVTNDTPEIASPGPNITFEEDMKAIAAEVEKLKAEGVNKIIALTHVGYPRDKEAIAKIPGVDVVVGGHSHSLLSNTDPKAEGPYPTMIDNPEGYEVPVTQAASYSKYLGEFAVTFDDNGVVKEAKGDPILLDKSIMPDAGVLERIKALGAPIEEMKSKVVAETAAPIDGSRETCRARECEMGNLITDAMLDRLKGQGVTIAVQNGGGIRASIDQGPVTMGEVLTVLPFQNTLATFEISGKDLVASLESGVSEIEEGKGKFPQVGGLRYSFDKSVKPNEGRIKSVEVMEDGAWKPIEPEKLYLAATNNFVRGGGDGYKLFASNARNAYDFGPSLEQVVADYLAANQPYTPKLEGRVSEVGATQVAAGEPAKPAETAQAAPAVPELPTASGDIANTPPTVPSDAAPAQPAPAAPMEAAPAQTAPAQSMAGESSHVIETGDTYWDLAEKSYGDGAKWKAISAANPEYRPRRLPVGATLRIPAAN